MLDHLTACQEVLTLTLDVRLKARSHLLNQATLSPTLPPSAALEPGHQPFGHLVTIEKFFDRVEVLPSLQKPKKAWRLTKSDPSPSSRLDAPGA